MAHTRSFILTSSSCSTSITEASNNTLVTFTNGAGMNISDISLYNEASAYSLLLETFLPWHKMISVLVPNGNYNYTGVVGILRSYARPEQGSFTAKGEPLDVDIGFVPKFRPVFRILQQGSECHYIEHNNYNSEYHDQHNYNHKHYDRNDYHTTDAYYL